MDGASLKYELRNLINEDVNSGFVDDRTSYNFLWEAAREFVANTNSLKSSQSITTVADQSGYTLNADFLKLWVTNSDKDFVIKYNDGTNNTFIPWKPYEKIIVEDNTTSVSIPSFFTILDDPTLDSRVTGTTTSAGASSAGECTLTDTAGDFSDVSAGDIVHNTTDGSTGVVLSKTSSTVLVTALFGGTSNDWTSSDAYVIQPGGRFQLRFSQPPSTAGHTVTVEYVQAPAPVFSDYGMYRFNRDGAFAIIKYAAWLYKYRDREPNFGDNLFQHFRVQVSKINGVLESSIGKNILSVSFKKRL